MIDDPLSSLEFRGQDPIPITFNTAVDEATVMQLNIIDEDDHILLEWNSGILQFSESLIKNRWDNVTVSGNQDQKVTSPYRVKKDKKQIFFRLKD